MELEIIANVVGVIFFFIGIGVWCGVIAYFVGWGFETGRSKVKREVYNYHINKN